MVDPSPAVPVAGKSAGPTSHEAAICRFDHEEVAEKYPSQFGDGWRDRREVRSIHRALKSVRPGSHVLDLPCGAGRLLDILVSCGFRVTCADYSDHMVRMAQRRWETIRDGHCQTPEPEFVVRDVMRTGYPDRHFDAVVCNRLFHHFRESAVRIQALRELRRISRGPVIVSFFNAFAIEAVRFQLKHAFRRTIPRDRVPIPAWRFLNDVRRAGLTPVSLHAVAWGISPLWHVVSIPTAARITGSVPFGTTPRSEAV